MFQYIQKFSGEGFLDKGSNLNPFFGGEGEGLKAKMLQSEPKCWRMERSCANLQSLFW